MLHLIGFIIVFILITIVLNKGYIGLVSWVTGPKIANRHGWKISMLIIFIIPFVSIMSYLNTPNPNLEVWGDAGKDYMYTSLILWVIGIVKKLIDDNK